MSFFDQGNVQWLQGIKGLNDSIPPGSRREVFTGQPGVVQYTNDLSNVKVRFGNIFGRGGMTSYQGAIASSSNPIIGLFAYNRANGVPNSLVRMTPTKLQILIGSTWTDITGDALNGLANSQPQYTIQNDILIYTVDGQAQVQAYGSNTGVLADFPVGTIIDPGVPFAKSCVSYMQFLLLGNVSGDGSYNDIFDGWRLIEYSDNPFASWTSCTANTIDLYQTPGDLVAMKVMGRVCMCYKTDGVIRLTWTGGLVRFTQELIPGSVGCAAPMSVVDLGNFGHVYLGTNGVLYHVTPTKIDAVGFENLSTTLPPILELERFRYARGFVLPTIDLYVLLYDRTGLGGQFNNSFVAWNYRTGEFVKGALGQQVIAGEYFRPVNDAKEVGLVTTTDKVEEFDSTTNSKDDDGVAFKRYWTSGWHKLADEEGYLYGVAAVMRKNVGARIKISVARNMSQRFEHEQMFSLRSDQPEDQYVECNYRFPSPVFGSWFNVRVDFYHDTPTALTELLRIGFVTLPKHKIPGSLQQQPDTSSNVLG